MPNHSTHQKLEAFARLQDGWHYGMGNPPTASTLKYAKAILGMYEAVGLQETDAFCSQDGEVMVTAYFENGYLECDINPDGSCWFQHDDGRELLGPKGPSF